MTKPNKPNPFAVLKSPLAAASTPRSGQDDAPTTIETEPTTQTASEPATPVSSAPYLVDKPATEATETDTPGVPAREAESTPAPGASSEAPQANPTPAETPAQEAGKPKKEQTQQISLHIPQSLYRRWRIGLTATGNTGTEIIQAFIESWLKEHQDEIHTFLSH